ncbi:MAG: hypothetical protein ABI645_13495 [Pseudomonadota bacterium]
MRKLATAASTAVFTLASFAQQPQCLKPDFVNGLVHLGRSELTMTVTRGSAGFLGNFRPPAGFSLIGTGVRDASTSVAYKTSLASDKAHAALVAALGVEGWALEATPGAGAAFNVAGGLKEGTLCRNGERRTVVAAEAAGTTYVNVITLPSQRLRDCNAPDPSMSMARGADVPRFQFPAGTTLAQGGFGGGGGSNTSWSTSSRIISNETPAQLVDHLASQIAGQGWQSDSGWSGSRSAGSTWRKTIDGQSSSGMLDIIRVGEGAYEVSFSLVSAQ